MIKKPVPTGTDPIIVPPNMDYIYLENSEQVAFDPDTADFKISNGWWLSELSLIAYESPGFIKQILKLKGFSGFKFFDVKSCQGFVAYNDETVVVSFRGTEVKSHYVVFDAIAEVKIKLVPFYNYGKVHAGFKESLDCVWDKETNIKGLLDELKSKNPDIKVFFTGHSLGGATATLAGVLYSHTTAIYTYGSPKVGDADFVSSIKCRLYRLILPKDMIPHLPPNWDIPFMDMIKFVQSQPHFVIENNDTVSFHTNKEYDLLKSLAGSANKFGKGILGFIKNNIETNILQEKPSSPDNDFKTVMENYFLNDITSHAPIFYCIGLWNSYVESVTV